MADRILTLTLRRDERSNEVLARGGGPQEHSILQRTGFIPVVRIHETYHRLGTNLQPSEEEALAQRAVARLRAIGYRVTCDAAFDTNCASRTTFPSAPRWPTWHSASVRRPAPRRLPRS